MKSRLSFVGAIEMPAVKPAKNIAKPVVLAGIPPAAQRAIAWACAMRHAVAGRRALARMDERMFADIGISQSEAAFEMKRKPWDTASSRAERCR
jgi:uncharacterized protein YjiS (DUF1127 family)